MFYDFTSYQHKGTAKYRDMAKLVQRPTQINKCVVRQAKNENIL